MYPPPSKSVVQQLMQGVLESITYGKYTIHLLFENGIRLSFSAPFRFSSAAYLGNTPVNEFPLAESNLVRALGCPVVDVECEEDGTLHLVFSNGDGLVIYANDPRYEAY